MFQRSLLSFAPVLKITLLICHCFDVILLRDLRVEQNEKLSCRLCSKVQEACADWAAGELPGGDPQPIQQHEPCANALRSCWLNLGTNQTPPWRDCRELSAWLQTGQALSYMWEEADVASGEVWSHFLPLKLHTWVSRINEDFPEEQRVPECVGQSTPPVVVKCDPEEAPFPSLFGVTLAFCSTVFFPHSANRSTPLLLTGRLTKMMRTQGGRLLPLKGKLWSHSQVCIRFPEINRT